MVGYYESNRCHNKCKLIIARYSINETHVKETHILSLFDSQRTTDGNVTECEWGKQRDSPQRVASSVCDFDQTELSCNTILFYVATQCFGIKGS